MNHLARPPIAVYPERTLRAGRPGVINVFLVRAADDAVGLHYALDAELVEERDYLFGDLKAVANVTMVAIPLAHLRDFAAVLLDDPGDQLGCPAVVGAVVSQ